MIVGQRYSQKQEALEYERQVHAAADSGPLRGRVHFLGVRNDVDRLLNEFTLLAHPARQEPLGRVLLEAAAAGVPVVATDVGGTREIFPAETASACLVPPDDPAALAAAIVAAAEGRRSARGDRAIGAPAGGAGFRCQSSGRSAGAALPRTDRVRRVSSQSGRRGWNHGIQGGSDARRISHIPGRSIPRCPERASRPKLNLRLAPFKGKDTKRIQIVCSVFNPCSSVAE